jgi:hypothetical protein
MISTKNQILNKIGSKMKTKIFKSFFSSKIALFIFLILFTFCSSPVGSDADNYSIDDLSKQLESIELEDLSKEEVDGLLFMREEEKLARDFYVEMYGKWKSRIFSNIAESEQKHMNSVKILLDRYSIIDPVENNEHGVFQNEELQNLYIQLVEKGNQSLVEALKVGATIEEIDILDLQEQLFEVVDNEDISLVYNNLLRGSRNHLRAFVKNINQKGEIYLPQKLSVEAYDEIVNSELERGKGKRNGKGKRGKG